MKYLYKKDTDAKKATKRMRVFNRWEKYDFGELQLPMIDASGIYDMNLSTLGGCSPQNNIDYICHVIDPQNKADIVVRPVVENVVNYMNGMYVMENMQIIQPYQDKINQMYVLERQMCQPETYGERKSCYITHRSRPGTPDFDMIHVTVALNSMLNPEFFNILKSGWFNSIHRNRSDIAVGQDWFWKCIVMGRLMDKSCDAETKSAIRKMYPNIAKKIR